MSCPVCRRAKCRWIDLKDPKRLSTERLVRVINHNIDYIDMLGREGSIGADSEERMYGRLGPYTEEVYRRKGK